MIASLIWRRDRVTMTDKMHCGGCHCGHIRYEVSGASIWKAHCYCDSCTRVAGAPVVAWAGIQKSRFRVLRGSISIYESSSGVLRGFCRECGTSLTYQKDPSKIAGAQDHVFIATRTLDDPNAFPPDEHVYYSERVEWLNVEDARPHHERLSADYAYLQLATLNQKR
jgi:hypothetical protein